MPPGGQFSRAVDITDVYIDAILVSDMFVDHSYQRDQHGRVLPVSGPAVRRTYPPVRIFRHPSSQQGLA